MKRLILIILMLAALDCKAANKYWNPVSGTGWNTATNWSPSGVPGASDVAIFNADTNNSDCVINANINVAGILITNYTGTITQDVSRVITVGTTGWHQYDGTFNGSSAAITNTDGFLLYGGTFKSTSGTLMIQGAAWAVTNSPTFDANGGKVIFYRPIYNTVTVQSGDIHFNNVDISVEDSGYLTVIGDMYIDGTCTVVNRTFSNRGLAIGTIRLAGDLVQNCSSGNEVTPAGTIRMVGTGTQTISSVASGKVLPHIEVDKASGTLVLAGTNAIRTTKWTWLNGTLDATGSTLIVYPVYNTPVTVTPGAVAYNNVGIRISGNNADVTVSGTWDVNGNLELTVRDNIGLSGVDTGTFNVAGNLTETRGSQDWGASSCAIVMDGIGTIATVGNIPCASLTINTAGVVTLADSLGLDHSGTVFNFTAGTLDLSQYTATVNSNVTISAGAAFLDLTVGGSSPTNGRITCGKGLTGISNVALRVNVTATPAQVLGQTYTILSNTNVLSTTFESVTWLNGWSGAAAYTANSGKNVTLSGITQTGYNLVPQYDNLLTGKNVFWLRR